MLEIGEVTYREWNELDYLGSEEAMMGYLQEALEGEGIAGYLDAAADVVRARAILQLSKETGTDYKELVKSFPNGIEPNDDAIKRINEAMFAPLPV